jgi:hypothetical protein
VSETSPPRGGSFFEPVADAETPGVTMFTFRDCLLSKASFKGDFDETIYRCTLACDSVDLEGDLAGEVVVDDWEWDCG